MTRLGTAIISSVPQRNGIENCFETNNFCIVRKTHSESSDFIILSLKANVITHVQSKRSFFCVKFYTEGKIKKTSSPILFSFFGQYFELRAE